MMAHASIASRLTAKVNTLFVRRIRSAFALLLLVFISSPAWADCSYTSAFPAFVSANPVLSGSVTVGRDLPIGAEIYRSTYFSNTTVEMLCQPGNYQYQRNYLSTPFPASSFVRQAGKVVYNTSIPGIGAVVWVDGVDLPVDPADFSYAIPTTQRFSGSPGSTWVSFDVSLIKTSEVVGAGTINGSDLPSVIFGMQDMGTGHVLTTLRGQYSGQLNVVSRTCTTPDVNVDLGSHFTNELSGIGTTTHWVNVPIALIDCPAFFGRNSYIVDEVTGVSEPGTLDPNSIQYNISPVSAVVDASNGVMALQPDGVNPTAAGVGIQLANAGGAPMAYNSDIPSGLTLQQVDGANYVIPFQARYYQTAPAVTAGQANGAATVTLIYN